jgi:hypothetical protein
MINHEQNAQVNWDVLTFSFNGFPNKIGKGTF